MAFGELLLLYWRCMYRIPLPAVYIVSYGSRLFFTIVACYLSLSPEDRKRTAAGSQLLPRTLPCSKSHPSSQANTSLHHHRDPNPQVHSLVSENTAETMTLAVPHFCQLSQRRLASSSEVSLQLPETAGAPSAVRKRALHGGSRSIPQSPTQGGGHCTDVLTRAVRDADSQDTDAYGVA